MSEFQETPQPPQEGLILQDDYVIEENGISFRIQIWVTTEGQEVVRNSLRIA